MCCLNSGDAWFESRLRQMLGFWRGHLGNRLIPTSGARSRDGSVGAAVRPEPVGPSNRGSIHSYVLQNVETGCGAHPIPFTIGICGSLLGDRAAGARS